MATRALSRIASRLTEIAEAPETDPAELHRIAHEVAVISKQIEAQAEMIEGGLVE